jgi:hypothetical protein
VIAILIYHCQKPINLRLWALTSLYSLCLCKNSFILQTSKFFSNVPGDTYIYILLYTYVATAVLTG